MLVTPEQDEDPFDLVEACANLSWDISCCANLPGDSSQLEPLPRQPPTSVAGSDALLIGKAKAKTDEGRSRPKVRAGRRRRVVHSSPSSSSSSSSPPWSTPQWLLLVLGLPLLLLFVLQLRGDQEGDCSLGSCNPPPLRLPSPSASTISSNPLVQLPPQLLSSQADNYDPIPVPKGVGSRSSRSTPSAVYGAQPQTKSYSPQQQCVLVLPEHIVIHMSASDSQTKSSERRSGLPLLTNHHQQASPMHSSSLKSRLFSSINNLINRLRSIASAPGRLCALLSNWVRHVARYLKLESRI